MPSGSTCVAWASSAASLRSNQSEHSTRVVTVRSGRDQLSSHSAYGLSSPSAVSASWKASMRARLKVWW